MEESLEQIAAAYDRFAVEAHGRSQLYEDLAHQVACDESTLSFLSALPDPKRQPNLLFAAVRYTCGTPTSWKDFLRLLTSHRDRIRGVILRRRTQTNEPARCATLLPLLALLPQPLALLEVGAAAGLCLIPDRYAYTFNHAAPIAPSSEVGVTPPVFACQANADTPIPTRNVDVVWRAGLDLEPVRLNNSADVAWLEALVWPDEHNRLSLLRQALNVARRNPPPVFEGDLRRHLPALAAQAPPGGTLVIFHSAVLAYISVREERMALAETMARLKAVWISNEAPDVSPCERQPINLCSAPGEFLLARHQQAIACTESHGRYIRWLSPGSTPSPR